MVEEGLDWKKPASKTRIIIPVNSLVDASGRLVQGKVEVICREYRDAVEVIAAGIPMHFGDGYFFQTAGMFRIEATQWGQPVFMKKGATYSVVFERKGLPDVGFYRLDEAKGEWIFEPSAVAKGSGATQTQAVPVADFGRKNAG